MSAFFVNTILTQALFLGVAASSLIFLSAYGGMVSLAQVAIFGIAGFAVGNAVTNGNSKGLNLGWNPWWGVLLGIAVATLVAFLLGALASRSAGIYFLMIPSDHAFRSPAREAMKAARPNASVRCRATANPSEAIRTGSSAHALSASPNGVRRMNLIST